MILQLRRIHLIFWIERGVLVQIRKEYRLRVRRLDVFTGAAVTVTAGADFVVERAYVIPEVSREDDCGRKGKVNVQLTLSCSVPKMEAR